MSKTTKYNPNKTLPTFNKNYKTSIYKKTRIQMVTFF